jgi:hypothetical protein
MGWIQRAIEMEDHTNAICPNCLNPLESWKVIDAGICPKCNARITAEDIRDGWCVECGKPLCGEEVGMDQCFDCLMGETC